jgi:hypothetical protein
MDPITAVHVVRLIKVEEAIESWERLNEMIPFINDEMAHHYKLIRGVLDELYLLQDEIKKG